MFKGMGVKIEVELACTECGAVTFESVYYSDLIDGTPGAIFQAVEEKEGGAAKGWDIWLDNPGRILCPECSKNMRRADALRQAGLEDMA